MRIELEQRIANEYRYASKKMQETTSPQKKLFYFSVLFGEAQRVLNIEWDRDLVLVFSVSNFVFTQVSASIQGPQMALLPINWGLICEKLTQATLDLATYYEKPDQKRSKNELVQILGRLSEIAYAVSGNGSYLLEKGAMSL
jgi:hypothetical protein